MNYLKKLPVRLYELVSSRRFIWVITALLVLESLWIALSGRYPMAFDEDFHVGIIKLYASHLDPFWQAHPAGADSFGAITRDPSYLYHYLMSFPFRIIRLFTNDLNTQVLVMRFMNIALFASGIPLYRKLLLRFKASYTTVHTVLLLFILVPIVPLLAAQVNYDNLIFPLTALSLLLALKVSESFTKERFDLIALLQLILVCGVSSLVKYAFLPIALAIFMFLIARMYQSHRGIKAALGATQQSWQVANSVKKWLLIAACIVMGVLFVERYAVNLVRYHTPVPDCAQVLLYDQCQHYGPWIRDYNFAQNKPSDAEKSPIAYTQHWFYGMWFRSFFAVDGPTSNYATRGPLTLPALSAIVLAVASGAALVYAGRRMWKLYDASALYLFTIVVVVYTAVLWVTEYQLFLQTAHPVAINGRYMLLLLPGIMLVAALAIKQSLRLMPRATGCVAIAAVLCFAWGGGTATYIIRSEDNWYWPNTSMTTANHAAQRVLRPITPGSSQLLQFLH